MSELVDRVLAFSMLSARQRMHESQREDRIARFARGEFHDLAEALEGVGPEPQPISAEDLEEFKRWRVRYAAGIRAFVERHGAAWAEHVRQRWLVEAEMIEEGGVSDAGVAAWRKAGRP